MTGGKHTMSTTKKGKVLRRAVPYDRPTKIWHVGAELGRLDVNYRMGHTLQASYITCFCTHPMK